jgi:hypothetical protein
LKSVLASVVRKGVSCVNTVISASVPTTMIFVILDVLTVAMVSALYAIVRFVYAKRNPRVIGREVLTIGNKPHEQRNSNTCGRLQA